MRIVFFSFIDIYTRVALWDTYTYYPKALKIYCALIPKSDLGVSRAQNISAPVRDSSDNLLETAWADETVGILYTGVRSARTRPPKYGEIPKFRFSTTRKLTFTSRYGALVLFAFGSPCSNSNPG